MLRIWRVKRLWGCGNLTDDVYYNDLLSNWILGHISITLDDISDGTTTAVDGAGPRIAQVQFSEPDFRRVYVGELLQYLAAAAVKIQSIVRRNRDARRVRDIRHGLEAISQSRRQATVRIIEYRSGRHPHGSPGRGKQHTQKSGEGSTALGGSCTSSITTAGLEEEDEEEEESPFHPEYQAHPGTHHGTHDPTADRHNSYAHSNGHDPHHVHGAHESHHPHDPHHAHGAHDTVERRSSHLHGIYDPVDRRGHGVHDHPDRRISQLYHGAHDPVDRRVSPALPSNPKLKKLIERHQLEQQVENDEQSYTTPYGATYLLSPTNPYKATKYKLNASSTSLAVT